MDNEQIVYEDVKAAAAQDLSQLYGNFDQLKKTAIWFLDGVVQSVSELQAEEALMNSYGIVENINLFYRAMNKSTQLTQDIVLFVSALQNSINDFLGREIYLLYVFEDGTMLNIDRIHQDLVYERVTHGSTYKDKKKDKWIYESGGKFNSIGFMNQLADYLKNDKDSMRGKIQDRLDRSDNLRNLVYATASSRYIDNATEEHMHYSPSKHTFWWRINHYPWIGWTTPISNLGPIKEAYAAAVINENPNITNENIEYGVQMLWQSHDIGNNTEALEKGDVVWNQNEKIQFAVKSGRWSTASVGQYLRFAYIISNLKTLTPKELEQILPDIANPKKSASAIIQKLDKEVEKKVDNQLGAQ